MASRDDTGESAAPEQTPAESDRVLLSPLSRFIDLTTVIVPIFIFVAAIFLLWGHAMNWMQLGIVIGMYLLTGFGVTVGFHRLFTHRAFETSAAVRYTLAILGSLCVQGPLLWWVAVHRQHHHHSDEPGDPHSPHTHGHGFFALLRGAWHAHAGWLFLPDDSALADYVPDLMKDRWLVRINDLYWLWTVLSLLIPAALAGLVSHSWIGALLGLAWGGILRIFMVHHITWSVNSVCHIWGSQPFKSHDHSKNNWIVGLLALGEGWHNNHHAFPTSAAHGIGWRQPDFSYWLIRAMGALGLATRVRVPSRAAMAAKAKAAR